MGAGGDEWAPPACCAGAGARAGAIGGLWRRAGRRVAQRRHGRDADAVVKQARSESEVERKAALQVTQASAGLSSKPCLSSPTLVPPRHVTNVHYSL